MVDTVGMMHLLYAHDAYDAHYAHTLCTVQS